MKISTLTRMGQPSPPSPAPVHTPGPLAARTYPDPARTSASGYYPVTLVGEDGSHTPLKGKSLLVDLGDKRLLEIHLNRFDNGYLHMWAPARLEDKYFHWTVFRPGCANSFYLELERVDDPDESVAAKSKAAVLYEESKPLP
jgi:hypothetical protein